jgi:hypothetical protein
VHGGDDEDQAAAKSNLLDSQEIAYRLGVDWFERRAAA